MEQCQTPSDQRRTGRSLDYPSVGVPCQKRCHVIRYHTVQRASDITPNVRHVEPITVSQLYINMSQILTPKMRFFFIYLATWGYNPQDPSNRVSEKYFGTPTAILTLFGSPEHVRIRGRFSMKICGFFTHFWGLWASVIENASIYVILHLKY